MEEAFIKFFCKGLESNKGRRPSQACTEGNKQTKIPFLESGGFVSLVQGQRNGRGGSISVFVQIAIKLIQGNLESLGQTLHNSCVCLMRDHVIDLTFIESVFCKQLYGRAFHDPNRGLEDLSTVHLEEMPPGFYSLRRCR